MRYDCAWCGGITPTQYPEHDDYPICLSCIKMAEEAIERHEREERMARKYGYRLHSDCGQYTLEVQASHTRNYGGGWDTYYRCLFCGYEEVCV